MIDVDGLTVHYGNTAVLRDLSFTVKEGEYLLISGPTGCGKSTLALTLCGLVPRARPARVSGRVMVAGLDVRQQSPHALASTIGIVFQNPATQLFNGVVEDEAAFAPRNLGLSEPEVDERTTLALESVGIAHLRRRAIRTLSAGEKQRLAIASVLSLKPRVLVLDEPTANLDWQGVEMLVSTLARLQGKLPAGEGLTVLVIEHRLPAFCRQAGRMLVLQDGALAADGIPADVLAERERVIDLGLRFPRHGGAAGLKRFVPPGICPPRHGKEPLVTLQGVGAGYHGREVLGEISCSFYPGEFTALVGANGAGKSTLANVLAGLVKPRRGKVVWARSLRRLAPGRRVGFLFQNAFDQLIMDTVAEEAAFAPRNLNLDADKCSAAALAATGLTGLGHRAPTSLSAGQQQSSALAAVLAAEPALLILDEPTRGQDWLQLSRLMAYLRALTRRGMSVLLITHDDKLICRFAERIICLEGGRLTADGLPASGRGRQQIKLPEVSGL
jgi:energy-coupling factor transporter ATP-binding protein EcfA2